jgi:hypothetical protein
MQQHPERFREFVGQMKPKIPDILKMQFQTAIDAGSIRPMRVEHLIINMLSMCMFPFVARNMLSIVFGFEGNDFEAFIEERKQLVSAMVFNGVSNKVGE